MKKKYIVLVVVVIAFVALQLFLKSYISEQKEYREIMVSNPFNTLPPTEYLGTYVATVALGGFKPLLVDYLWMKQDKLQEDKQFEEIVLLLNIIARLQPRFTDVWSFNAYHMIYNISAQEGAPQQKWHWVRNGIDYIKEGMRHNPDNIMLTQWLALFYYHRVPQEPYFMQQVEQAEGTDSYEVASRWYQKTIELCRKENLPGYAEIYTTMYNACRFRHSFELMKKSRFDEAITELETLAGSHRDIMEIERLKDLIEVVRYDKEMSQVRLESPDFVSADGSLVEKYGEIINKHIGYDFMPINARVELIFSRFIRRVYLLTDQGNYKAASEQIRRLRILNDKISPKLDSHPFRWYYRTLSERFGQLQDLVDAECYLRAQGVSDFKADQRGLEPVWDPASGEAHPEGRRISELRRDRVSELKLLYEEYIRKYGSRWLDAKWSLAEEKGRFDRLYK
ncbi:MAG: hypothetical protein AB1599_04145 [Planctomycetota bacterium]